MTTSTETRNAQDELEFIRQTMIDSRQTFVEDGKIYITWGTAIAIGCGAVYFQETLGRELHAGIIFLLAIMTGIGYTFWNVSNKKKGEHAETFAGRLHGAIWTACGFAIMLLGVVLPVLYGFKLTTLHPMYISPLIAMVLGIAYYTVGTIAQLGWMRFLTAGWWLASMLMLMMNEADIMGTFALTLILLEVIPGIVFYRNWKSRPASTHNSSAISAHV